MLQRTAGTHSPDSHMKITDHRWLKLNKPDRATMRPDCVSACIDFGAKYLCDIYGDTDGQADEATE